MYHNQLHTRSHELSSNFETDAMELIYVNHVCDTTNIYKFSFNITIAIYCFPQWRNSVLYFLSSFGKSSQSLCIHSCIHIYKKKYLTFLYPTTSTFQWTSCYTLCWSQATTWVIPGPNPYTFHALLYRSPFTLYQNTPHLIAIHPDLYLT